MWSIKNWAVLATVFVTSLALTAWYSHSKGKQAGMTTVQALWTAEHQLILQTQAEESAKARGKEQTLQDQMAKQRKAHQNEVSRLVRSHAGLLDSLRQRSDRPASLADMPQDSDPTAGSAAGCTGSQLYRQDGEFLAREAARADQLRIALSTCIADRAEIERQLN